MVTGHQLLSQRPPRVVSMYLLVILLEFLTLSSMNRVEMRRLLSQVLTLMVMDLDQLGGCFNLRQPLSNTIWFPGMGIFIVDLTN